MSSLLRCPFCRLSTMKSAFDEDAVLRCASCGLSYRKGEDPMHDEAFALLNPGRIAPTLDTLSYAKDAEIDALIVPDPERERAFIHAPSMIAKHPSVAQLLRACARVCADDWMLVVYGGDYEDSTAVLLALANGDRKAVHGFYGPDYPGVATPTRAEPPRAVIKRRADGIDIGDLLVERKDGAYLPDGQYVVLSLSTDEVARHALAAYAMVARKYGRIEVAERLLSDYELREYADSPSAVAGRVVDALTEARPYVESVTRWAGKIGDPESPPMKASVTMGKIDRAIANLKGRGSYVARLEEALCAERALLNEVLAATDGLELPDDQRISIRQLATDAIERARQELTQEGTLQPVDPSVATKEVKDGPCVTSGTANDSEDDLRG